MGSPAIGRRGPLEAEENEMGKRAGVAFLIILAGGMKIAAAQEPAAPQGPVSYWKFDETSGTNAANNVPGGPAGTLQSGVGFSTDVPPTSYPNPGSFTFNGTTGGVVSVPNFGTFTSMSVSVWAKRTGTTGGRQSIVSYKETGGGFVLSVNEANPNEYSRIWLNQGGWQYKENTTALTLNAWVHLCATYASGNLRLYIGGIEVAPSNAITGNMTQPNAVTGIGARNSLDQHYFPGLIDDVRVYSRELTANEVAVLAAGCPKPTALTTTPGGTTITLNWTAPTGVNPGYTYNVKRSTTSGSGYATIAPMVSGTTFIDTPPSVGVPYYYVVSAVSAAESGDCTEASGQVLPISAVPPTGLMTDENGATATFNIVFNQALSAGNSVTFTVTSNNGNEGQVSGSGQPVGLPHATSITFTTPGPVPAGTKIPITVYGIDDDVADPPTGPNYAITVTFTSTQTNPFSGFTIPPIACTNNDNDTPGITISRTSGLMTSEGGGTDSFTVRLTTQPTSAVNMSLTSSVPTEGTVSPTSLQFTTTKDQAYTAGTGIGGWNVAHLVTVTGVDDSALDFTQPYTIITGQLSSLDPNYNFNPPDISVINLDNEVPPALPEVWGGKSCGLLGLEAVLLLLVVRLRRKPGLKLGLL